MKANKELNCDKFRFGEWVCIDNDPSNEGQVIDFDVLNDAYCIDKNGKWQWHNSDKITKTHGIRNRI